MEGTGIGTLDPPTLLPGLYAPLPDIPGLYIPVPDVPVDPPDPVDPL